MAISDADVKLLWGRAAGMCSNPQCQRDLTVLLEHGAGYNIGEMAHVIAKNPGGPRGVPEGGSDTYQNLILVCPTCHRMIDKAPDGEYSEEMLLLWKDDHETRIRELGSETVFSSKNELWAAVHQMLLENRILWRDIGPHSNVVNSDPGSNLYTVWDMRKLDTIIPNNARIINYIQSNLDYLNGSEREVFVKFKMHAQAFEANQYGRLDQYPLFPEEFSRIFDQ